MFRSERDGGAANEEVARRPDLGGRSTVYGTKGAVACEHPGAALAGLRILDVGGNAADACVSMAACMDCHRARQASLACNFCHEQK